MMASIGFQVDEIVTTRDNAVQYTYVHLKKREKEEDVGSAVHKLESYGVKCSEIFGYGTVASNTVSALEFIEDHPGFQTLVEHDHQKNKEYHRWTADGYNPLPVRGYSLLKNKLLAKRASASGSSGGGGAASSVGADGGSAISSDEEAEEPVLRQKTARSSGEGEVNKRRRTISSVDGVYQGGMDASAVDLFRTVYNDANRKNNDNLSLKETVMKLQHDAELRAKDDESKKIGEALKRLEVEFENFRLLKVVV